MGEAKTFTARMEARMAALEEEVLIARAENAGLQHALSSLVATVGSEGIARLVADAAMLTTDDVPHQAVLDAVVRLMVGTAGLARRKSLPTGG